MADLSKLLAEQRTYFLNHWQHQPVSARKIYLRKLRKAILAHEKDIAEAIQADLGGPQSEVFLSEVFAPLLEIDEALQHLDNWCETHDYETPLYLTGVSGKSRRVPKGVVLILSPWNFPINLALGPLASAVSAGCCAMIKPSEFTPNCSAVLQKIVDEVFPTELVAVVQGGPDVAQSLTALPFHHIFFTGSPQVGALVMEAAAANLTPVTLELGGMNPAVVSQHVNLRHAARKVAYAKYINAGQSCVSINRLYVHQSVFDKFATLFEEEIQRLIPDVSGMARLVSQKHFGRMMHLYGDARGLGAKPRPQPRIEPENLRFSPCLLVEAPAQCEIWHDEIFGPLLPAKPYANLTEVIEELNELPEPLAAYIFSAKRAELRIFEEKVRAGHIGCNDTTIQFLFQGMPFGGNQVSGIGRAHGFAGFEAFTNVRTLTRQRAGWAGTYLLHPPANKLQRGVIGFLRWLYGKSPFKG